MYFCGAVWFRLDIARGNPAKVNHWCMQFILTANDTILTGGYDTSQYCTRGHNTPIPDQVEAAERAIPSVRHICQ